MPFDIGGFVYDSTFIQDYGKSGVITNGLVLYLDTAFAESYPKGGTTWYDLSGNGNHGTLTNGPTFNSGNGGSIVFDGTNDYVDLNYNFGIFSSYTFSFWARQDVANRFLVSYKSSTFSQYWYGDNSWKYIHGGVSGEYYYPKNLNIPLGSWGNFVVTYDGSNVSIYRQGVFQGQQSTTGTSDWTSGIMLGNAVTINNYAYGGRISNFGLYNRALSSTEITQNYNALKGRYGL